MLFCHSSESTFISKKKYVKLMLTQNRGKCLLLNNSFFMRSDISSCYLISSIEIINKSPLSHLSPHLIVLSTFLSITPRYNTELKDPNEKSASSTINIFEASSKKKEFSEKRLRMEKTTKQEPISPPI